MKSSVVNGFGVAGYVFPRNIREVSTLVFSRRARRAAQGLMRLRRAHEYLVVMATLEGVQPVRRPYYENYVDALDILSARAELIARFL